MHMCTVTVYIRLHEQPTANTEDWSSQRRRHATGRSRHFAFAKQLAS